MQIVSNTAIISTTHKLFDMEHVYTVFEITSSNSHQRKREREGGH